MRGTNDCVLVLEVEGNLFGLIERRDVIRFDAGEQRQECEPANSK